MAELLAPWYSNLRSSPSLGLLLMLAVVLGTVPHHRHRLLVALPIAAVPIALTLLEPDLSTALLLALVAAATLCCHEFGSGAYC